MRDAFGGVFTMNFLLVFIFIYVAFTAVSLNYAKAYRVKNAVIDFVEQNEIIDPADIEHKDNLLEQLDSILNRFNYVKTCASIPGELEEGKIQSDEGDVVGYCHNGIVIYKKSDEDISGTTSKVIYYQVTTYADWQLGALNKLLALAGRGPDDVISGTWAVNGEAKVVAKVED